MSPFFRYALLLFALFCFAGEPALARLKKVPVSGGSTVIQPSATKYKEVKTKKLKTKKVRFKKKKSKVREEQVLEMDEISASKLASLVEKAETIVVINTEKKPSMAITTQQIEVSKPSAKDATVVETVVDRISEASPDQLTVEKRKKKNKWKFWKKKEQ